HELRSLLNRFRLQVVELGHGFTLELRGEVVSFLLGQLSELGAQGFRLLLELFLDSHRELSFPSAGGRQRTARVRLAYNRAASKASGTSRPEPSVHGKEVCF